MAARFWNGGTPSRRSRRRRPLLMMGMLLLMMIVLVPSRSLTATDFVAPQYTTIDAIDGDGGPLMVNGTFDLPFSDDVLPDDVRGYGALIRAFHLGKDARLFVRISVSENSTSAVNVTWIYQSDYPGTEHVSVVQPGTTMNTTVTLRADGPAMVGGGYEGAITLELMNHSAHAWITYHVTLVAIGNFQEPNIVVDTIYGEGGPSMTSGTFHLPFFDEGTKVHKYGALIRAFHLGKDARVFVQVVVSENSTSAVNVTWSYSSGRHTKAEHVFVVAPGATMNTTVTLRADSPASVDAAYGGTIWLGLVNHSAHAWITYHVKLVDKGSFNTPFASWEVTVATLVLAGIIATTVTRRRRR